MLLFQFLVSKNNNLGETTVSEGNNDLYKIRSALNYHHQQKHDTRFDDYTAVYTHCLGTRRPHKIKRNNSRFRSTQRSVDTLKNS